VCGMDAHDKPGEHRLLEVAGIFLRLGATAFGGPAVHIALMEDEFVTRRRWIERERYLDLVAATSVIPGPNSTEVAIHLGWLRAGFPGLLVAGICFILPAALLTTLLAAFTLRYGALPAVAPFLRGMGPIVLAVLLTAVWRLGRVAIKNAALATIGLLVAGASLAGVGEIPALFGGGLLGMLWLRGAGRPKILAAVPLPLLALFFLKVGGLLYGSGYVLIAFLEGGLVHERGWLTQQQLFDAVAAGQLTPGPVFSTATFVGYQLAGGWGALVATVGIFLPAFVFVAILGPVLPRLRRSPWMAAFLDAVAVSAVALMAAVAVKLALTTLTIWPAWLIALLAVALGLRGVSSAWLVLGGAALGGLLTFATKP
jgi:chromate transporter